MGTLREGLCAFMKISAEFLRMSNISDESFRENIKKISFQNFF